MMYLVASLHCGDGPRLTNAESNHQRSTRLALWTHIMNGPQQRLQPTTPWLVRRADSRHVELQRLPRSH